MTSLSYQIHYYVIYNNYNNKEQRTSPPPSDVHNYLSINN